VTVPEVLTATVRIGAPPADVFPYFVDPVLIVQWLGEWADLRPEPGGMFALDFSTTPVRGEYVEVDPPRRVVFTWGVAGQDSLPPGSTTAEEGLSGRRGRHPLWPGLSSCRAGSIAASSSLAGKGVGGVADRLGCTPT
jgi:uncharacterized protein YndB with AHSA1/START domain